MISIFCQTVIMPLFPFLFAFPCLLSISDFPGPEALPPRLTSDVSCLASLPVFSSSKGHTWLSAESFAGTTCGKLELHTLIYIHITGMEHSLTLAFLVAGVCKAQSACPLERILFELGIAGAAGSCEHASWHIAVAARTRTHTHTPHTTHQHTTGSDHIPCLVFAFTVGAG